MTHAGSSTSGADGGPVVSVIVPIYNSARFLSESIESVLAQTLVDWELLLIDDGSTDESTEIAARFAAMHPGRIRCLSHPARENRGVSATRNLGLEHARGEFVAFLDADDVWFPAKLEEQLACLRQYAEAVMVYGRILVWYGWTGRAADRERDLEPDMGVALDRLYEPPSLLMALVGGSARAPSTSDALMRAAPLRGIARFEEAFKVYEDRTFFVRVQLAGPVYVADRCWGAYRQHPASCSATLDPVRDKRRARLAYLRWLERYLTERGQRGTALWDLTRRRSFPYRHPTASRLLGRLRRVRSTIRRLLPGSRDGALAASRRTT